MFLNYIQYIDKMQEEGIILIKKLNNRNQEIRNN